MFVAMWKGSGKRIKYSRRYGKYFELYGQKFTRYRKAVLSDAFIEEAGLLNEATFEAASLSLKTDYGIYITKIIPPHNIEKTKEEPVVTVDVLGSTSEE